MALQDRIVIVNKLVRENSLIKTFTCVPGCMLLSTPHNQGLKVCLKITQFKPYFVNLWFIIYLVADALTLAPIDEAFLIRDQI